MAVGVNTFVLLFNVGFYGLLNTASDCQWVHNINPGNTHPPWLGFLRAWQSDSTVSITIIVVGTTVQPERQANSRCVSCIHVHWLQTIRPCVDEYFVCPDTPTPLQFHCGNATTNITTACMRWNQKWSSAWLLSWQYLEYHGFYIISSRFIECHLFYPAQAHLLSQSLVWASLPDLLQWILSGMPIFSMIYLQFRLFIVDLLSCLLSQTPNAKSDVIGQWLVLCQAGLDRNILYYVLIYV